MVATPKPIGPGLNSGFLADPLVHELTEASPWIRQFDIVTMAKTKKAASEQLAAVGLPFTKADNLRILTGYHVEKLMDAGVITDDGAVYVYHSAGEGRPIVRVAPNEQPRVVARWGPVTWPTRHPTVVKIPAD